MRLRKNQKHFIILLEFRHGVTREIHVRASSREIAERRALKHNPEAIKVSH